MSRRIDLYAIGLFLLSSCVNTIPVEFGSVDPVPVMNAQFDAYAGDQDVYLSQSKVGSASPVLGAKVSVYVDGEKLADASDISDEDDRFAGHYRFVGGFKEGQRVRLTASKDDWNLSAECEVPGAPVIEAFDTCRIQVQSIMGSTEMFQFRITIRDIPGRTWYRVGVRRAENYCFTDAEGQKLILPAISELFLDTSSDPMLGSSGNVMSFFLTNDTYIVFSDEMFADGSCTLRLNADSYWMDEPYPYVDYGDFQPVHVSASPDVFPWVETLSFEEFCYIKAINNLENFGYQGQVIVEPTTIPSNVTGGIGFFSVTNSAEGLKLAKKCRPYEMDMIYYEDEY